MLIDEAVLRASAKAPLPVKVYRTQKARGVLALISGGYTVPSLRLIIQSPADRERIMAAWFPLFARPCPVRPRHGFVESRIVETPEALQTVIDETLAADAEGEILLMAPITATWSAVWTPSLLTYGRGHDGATAGVSTVSLPLIPRPSLSPDLLAAAGIVESPFIEAVGNQGTLYVTQLRDGPALASPHPDFIPSPLRVEAVVRPGGSLLEWEDRVKALAPGTVVYHPGGSLTDHYAIHCRCAGIPLLTSREPAVGEWLEPLAERPYDPNEVLRGIAIGESMRLARKEEDEGHPYAYAGKLCRLMLLLFHNSLALTGSYSFWLGVSAALMMRLGSVALRGEARHYNRKTGSTAPPKKSRANAYHEAFPFSLSRHHARLSRQIALFRYGQWGGSLGGKKWAECGLATAGLYEAVKRLATTPDEASVMALLSALNVAVHQAHNGGWWLGKFTNHAIFCRLAEGHPPTVMSSGVVTLKVAAVRVEEAWIERRKQEWAAWAPISLQHPPILRVMMEGLECYPLMRAFRHAPIPLPLIAERVSFIRHATYLEVRAKGPEGWRKVWKESPLRPQSVPTTTKE